MDGFEAVEKEEEEKTKKKRWNEGGDFLYASDDNEICTTVNVKNRLYF